MKTLYFGSRAMQQNHVMNITFEMCEKNWYPHLLQLIIPSTKSKESKVNCTVRFLTSNNEERLSNSNGQSIRTRITNFFPVFNCQTQKGLMKKR